MPIPTVASITPNLGHTGGGALVEILGTNFREPTEQTAAADEAIPIAPPSVEVLFGAVSSPRVAWISSSRLFASTPAVVESAVNVTVRNIDDDGTPIVGETVTVASGFQFRLPQLTTRSALSTILRNEVERMRRQIHPNVVVSVHTDYDDSTADLLNITKIATLPALVLQGPRTTENRFYSLNQRPNVTSEVPEEFFVHREPYTIDIGFDLLGVSNSQEEFMNLISTVITYYHKNKTIVHPATDDELELDFDTGAQPKSSPRFGNDNIRLFRGAIVIRGFDVGAFDGFVRDMVVDAARNANDVESPVELQPTTNLGDTFAVGASPGLPASSPAVTPAARTGLVFPKFGQNY